MKIISHVLSLFPNVSDIANVDPFAGFIQPKVKETTVTKTLKGQGPLLIAPGDERLVSVRTIMIRYTKNPIDTTVYVKRLFSHPAAADEDAEADRMLVAMGGMERCVMSIPPNDDGAKSVFVMKESPKCLYLQSAFVRTCMVIDEERNLMNGIIQLPPAVCFPELPKEAVVFDERGQSISFEVDYYVLVPYTHILAWCLCVSDHWRRMRGIFALEMDVTPEGKKESFILYFAVAKQSFERLKEACCRNFLRGKVDRRPLGTVGVETTGPAEISATFTYMEYPLDVNVAQIAPVLNEHFIPYSQVLQAEVEELRARQDEEELMKKRRETNPTEEEKMDESPD